jgi:hypothetical protein
LTRDAIQAANAELVKLVAGDPCQSASVLLAVGRVVGSEAGRSAKAALMADLSHASRAANADAEQQAVDAIGEQHPGIGAVLAGMGPKARRGVMKNPLLQLGIQAILGGGFGGLIGGGNHNNNGGGSSPTEYTGRRHRE